MKSAAVAPGGETKKQRSRGSGKGDAGSGANGAVNEESILGGSERQRILMVLEQSRREEEQRSGGGGGTLSRISRLKSVMPAMNPYRRS